MPTPYDYMNMIKDSEVLAEQVEYLKQLTKIVDPKAHPGAFKFIKELSEDDIYYPELRPYAVKCLEFLIRKFNLDIPIPTLKARENPVEQTGNSDVTERPPAVPTVSVGVPPQGTACSNCSRIIDGNCIIHFLPSLAGAARTLYFCSKQCHASINEVIEKIEIEETRKKLSRFETSHEKEQAVKELDLSKLGDVEVEIIEEAGEEEGEAEKKNHLKSGNEEENRNRRKIPDEEDPFKELL